jgi:uncharacterized protein (DUF1684 family)
MPHVPVSNFIANGNVSFIFKARTTDVDDYLLPNNLQIDLVCVDGGFLVCDFFKTYDPYLNQSFLMQKSRDI